MALRCLAVLLSFLMAGGVMASAQQKNISLKVSNVSIESALNTVKSQYGISIVTQIEGLDLSSKVSVDIKNASVTEGRFIELDVWCKKDQIRQIFGKLRDRLFLHRAVADVIHGCKREKAFPVK